MEKKNNHTKDDYARRCMATLCFFGALFLCLLAVGVLLKKATLALDPNVPKIQSMMSMKGKEHDVLFLGDSTTLEGVNPAAVDEVVGVESYNLASGGQQMLVSEMILRHYLTNNKKPKLVALGVFVGPKNFDDINSNVFLELKKEERDIYKRKRKRFYKREFDRSYLIFNKVPAFRYRGGVEWVLRRILKRTKNASVFVKGHLSLKGHSPAKKNLANTELVLDIKGLKSFVEYCDNNGLSLLVFEMPTHASYQKSSLGHKNVVRTIESLVNRQEKAHFVSFNLEDGPALEEDQWFNLNHLNGNGATYFSSHFLAEAVQGLLEKQ